MPPASIGPSDAPAPSESPEPSAAPESPPPTLGFEPAVVPAPAMSTAATIIAPGGDGLVAIGFDGGYGTFVWTSTDGREWRDVTPDGMQSVGMSGLVETDGGLVAVGRGDTVNVDAELAAAYLSDDGVTWRPASGGADMRGQMIDVIETGDGLFAVGGVPGADAAGVWRSTDGGETWERTGEDMEGAFVWSIAEGGPGLVISGWRRNPDPDAAVWTSADAGETWELADDPEAFTLSEGMDVLATDSGLIMTGGSLTGEEARIWTSPDGRTWSLAHVEGGLTGAMVHSVTATPMGHLAVGALGRDAAAWLSTDDGATWTPFGDPVPEAFFFEAHVTGDGLILSGATQTGTLETGIDARAAIWTVSLEN